MTWQEIFKHSNNNASSYKYIAMDGNIFVGQNKTSGDDNPGEAEVWEKKQGQWQKTITLTGEENNDGFGQSIALSGITWL